MRACLCTVVTPDHMDRALALYESAMRFGSVDFNLLLLQDEASPRPWQALAPRLPHFRIFGPGSVFAEAELMDLRGQFGDAIEKLCWTSKPAFMRFLLDRESYEAVLYLDSDVYFYGDYGFLLQLLEKHGLLLTPHWRPIRPEPDPMQFHCNFRDGLYNAGFIGASRGGLEALRWWYRMCRYRCEKDSSEGLFDDQRYLDLLPLHFPEVHVLRHLGCNVAEWNRHHLERSEVNGRVVIRDKWPLIFAHFTPLTIRYIDEGVDPHLERPLEEYRQALLRAQRLRARAETAAQLPC